MDRRVKKAYLSLGSNLGDRLINLKHALKLIDKRIGNINALSSVFETEPWNADGLFSFYNVVLCINTSVSPMQLLQLCKNIEIEMGQTSKKRINGSYSNRIIDIDIVALDDEVINQNELIIPHQHMHQRKFVLMPLNQIDSRWKHPVSKKNILELISECKDESQVINLKIDLEFS